MIPFLFASIAMIAGILVMIVKTQRLRVLMAIIASAGFLVFLVMFIQTVRDKMGVPL